MKNNIKQHLHFDGFFLMSVFFLLGLGIVIIYSSSGAYALTRNLPDTFFLFSHLKKVVIALVLFGIGFAVDYHIWKKLALPLTVLVLGLLIFLITSSSISGVNGAKRWISIASFGLQPSELAKIASVFFLAKFLEDKFEFMHEFKKGLLASLVVVGLLFALVVLQPDYSSALIILLAAITMVFAGGAKLSHMLALGSLGIPFLGFLMVSSPYRMQRVMAFVNPGENTASSYQSLQSLISLGNGGLTGTGLGTSTQKLGYPPMPFTDTIFAILGEELGFIGSGLCLMVFGVLVWRGLKISYRCADRFGSLASLGIIVSISITVLMHVGVCAAFFPTTGQPLPFVSYGGTALVTMMFFCGVVLNISMHPGKDEVKQKEVTKRTVHQAWAKQRIRA